mmetsp:Transcript_36807/g.86471  ORF Transcript_36807/g.86471 Transcript_36807/m.86471 type:complete len:96 (-) Transcript_36807:3391-3678(-)
MASGLSASGSGSSGSDVVSVYHAENFVSFLHQVTQIFNLAAEIKDIATDGTGIGVTARSQGTPGFTNELSGLPLPFVCQSKFVESKSRPKFPTRH